MSNNFLDGDDFDGDGDAVFLVTVCNRHAICVH